MNKLNSSIDIIPLQNQGSAMETNRRFSSVTGVGGGGGKPTSATDPRMFRDPLITSRVKTYLYENEDKVYIDVTEMADHLQRKYRDYRGKKKGPFRALVRRAYDEITENLTRQADSHWQDDEDEIDIESDSQIDAAMPAEYLQAYKQQMANRQNGNSSDKELIDISSDDDQAKIDTTAPKTPQQQYQRENMDIEHVAKRPHLDRNMAPTPKTMTHMPHDSILEIQKSHPEKSRKRPRDKENNNPLDTTIPKKKSKDIPTEKPSVKFSDIGGNNKVLETVANLLLHMKHPEVYSKLGISPPRGFLLHGPPGCGKTLLAHAIAGELQIPLLKVAAPELVAGVSGESEQRIRELFDQALAIAPCILFLDEIDSVAPHRATAQKEMERRIVSQLLSCLDELGKKENGNRVLVLGATNRPDSLDPALRRAGRFDREVSLGIPDKEARQAILKVHTSKVTLSSEVSLQNIASLTPGFVGADLVALIREAAMAAVNRTFDDLKKKIVPADLDDPNSSDVIIEEEKDKDVQPEVSDIVIEEDVASKTDVKLTEKPSEDESKTAPEKETKNSDPLESPKSPTVSSTEAAPETTADTSKENDKDAVKEADPETPSTAEISAKPEKEPVTVEEPKPASESADTPKTTVESDSVKPVNNETESKIEPEVIDAMQVEEIRSSSSSVKAEASKKLDEILSWLHDEPPLTEEQLSSLCVEQRDFDVALKNVQPSAKREGFATVPDVTWDDIGSLQEIRQELQMTIMAPIRYSEQFASLGLNTPTGVLLCGPPGCGKTLLAKAIANEAGINFISVKGPELMNMYVGESEKAVRQCFLRARNSAPCVIFFDELDSLCPKRSDGDNNASARVVNQMLTEMDGVESRKDVFLMAASNRPDIIDPAVLRPGRLDKILYVGLPNRADRVDILRALTKNGTKPKLSTDVNLEEVARSDRCAGYTGADLAAFVREAGVEALREMMSGLPGPAEICMRHLEAAFDKIRPSVQEKDMKHYEKLKKLYSVKKDK